MKKWIAIGLISVLGLSMAGCGEEENIEASVSEEVEKVEVEVETDDYIQEAEEEEIVVEEPEEQKEEVFIEAFNTSPTIEETVLWDEQDVKVTVTSLDYTSWSAVLNLTLENDSDKPLSFVGGSTSYCWYAINGYTIDDGFINVTVEPGTVEEGTISFNTTGLMVYGINEIAEIQMGLMVEDEDYNTFILEPQKLETSIAGSYDFDVDTYQEILENGVFEQLGNCNIDYLSYDELYSSNGISMISEMMMTQEDDEEGTRYALVLEMSNESDNYIYAVLSKVFINDVSVYDYNWTSETMMPNTKAALTIDLNNVASRSDDYTDKFFDNGVESVSFTLTIKNEDYVDALEPQEITIDFN